MQVQIKTTRNQRDLTAIANAVAETAAQSFLLGTDGFSGAVSSLFRVLELMRGDESVGAIAAALIEDTAAYTIAKYAASQMHTREFSKAEIAEFTSQNINEIRTICEQSDVFLSSTDVEYPSTNPLLSKVAQNCAYYFRAPLSKSVSDADKANLIEIINDAQARITTKRPTYFSPLWTGLFGPSAAASDYMSSWDSYRSLLIEQFEDQPVFGEEEFGARISQVYVPLRCWWGNRFSDQNENRLTLSGEFESRSYDKLTVASLEQTVHSWLLNYDVKDRIRFVSGGPGSGKSTFAKQLCSVLAARSNWRVLFIPLQRITGADHLENRINQFFMRELSGPFSNGPAALSGFGLDGHVDWLFVFDGLDELAKEGGGSESAAQDFASSLQDFVARVPTHLRARFVVLGRAPSMQEARKRLNLGDGKTLYVADLLPFSSDRYSYGLSQCSVEGNIDIIKLDQRADLWTRWALAKGKDTKPPPAMSAEELRDITKEPLLAHLLIVSGYVEEIGSWQQKIETGSMRRSLQRFGIESLARRHAAILMI